MSAAVTREYFLRGADQIELAPQWIIPRPRYFKNRFGGDVAVLGAMGSMDLPEAVISPRAGERHLDPSPIVTYAGLTQAYAANAKGVRQLVLPWFLANYSSVRIECSGVADGYSGAPTARSRSARLRWYSARVR
ncbi:MAG: hypothetical protein JWP89_3418 [Schlesneria sp.]|nr:hypothetical protein [Schlesneria sp.]